MHCYESILYNYDMFFEVSFLNCKLQDDGQVLREQWYWKLPYDVQKNWLLAQHGCAENSWGSK